jgi:hypothetical protein
VSPECGGEYTVVEWEEGREVMCAEHQTLWLKSQNIKAGGTFGRGLRLDAACYAATPPEVCHPPTSKEWRGLVWR